MIFKRHNRTLDIISQAESKDLLEEFGEVVLGHAKQFYSLIESPIVDTNCCTFPPKYSLSSLDTHLLDELKRVYVTKYPQYLEFLLGSSENFPQTCQKYEYVLINDKKLLSSTQNSPSYVMAKPLFPFPSPLANQDNCRPIKVRYFIKHTFQSPQSGISHDHTFVICRWPQCHPKHEYMGKTVQIWCKNVYETTNTVTPLDNITTQVLSADIKVNNESVLLVIPLCN